MKLTKELLVKVFEEINEFIDKNGKVPEMNTANTLEQGLCFRLQGILEDTNKVKALKQYDRHDLLTAKQDMSETLDDN